MVNQFVIQLIIILKLKQVVTFYDQLNAKMQSQTCRIDLSTWFCWIIFEIQHPLQHLVCIVFLFDKSHKLVVSQFKFWFGSSSIWCKEQSCLQCSLANKPFPQNITEHSTHFQCVEFEVRLSINGFRLTRLSRWFANLIKKRINSWIGYEKTIAEYYFINFLISLLNFAAN